MSFNIRYGTAADGEDHWTNRRDQVISLLIRHGPDLIGMQEALRFQIDEIRKALPGYAEIGVGRDDGGTAGEYSVILYRMARLKPVESGTFWFSSTPEKAGSRDWGATLPRICTWARFHDERDGVGFYAYNVHLDHQSQQSREKSVALLRERIAARKHADPVIVTGDFNADEQNPAIRAMNEPLATTPGDAGGLTLVDTFRVLHADAVDVGTFNSFKGTTTGGKIDFVFVPRGTDVLESSIIRDHRNGRYPSDHFPVMARIRLAK